MNGVPAGQKLLSKIVRRLLTITALALLGGFLAATLVRFAPGFDADERELDPSLSARSVQALRQAHVAEHSLFGFYRSYLLNLLHGDFGVSHALGQPVSNLLRERWPVTARVVGIGILLAWVLGGMLAFTASLWRQPIYEIFGIAISGACLCIPAAVLALVSVILNTPGYLAIALIVFPKVYRYCRNVLAKSYALPHVLAARARGLGEFRILARHVFPVAAPQVIALAGVTVSLALGAAIPVEALCGLPGIGQLAWQAALSRDLPLLVNLTVMVTVVTLLANASADVMNYILRPQYQD
jgi:peptide/nickel transport system permease protein